MKKAEAISILATSVRPREAKDRARYDKAVKMAIEALKSSERTVETIQIDHTADIGKKVSIPNGSDDTISRRAAIDAYGDWYVEEGTEEGFIGTVKQLLEGLPSAQPEQRWIPVTERLPEHGGRYLVSVLDGINRRTTVAPYMPRCKAWTMTGRMTYWKVIAWMPLPEPYKGGEM